MGMRVEVPSGMAKGMSSRLKIQVMRDNDSLNSFSISTPCDR
jgi:hypothetical protein